MLLFYFLQIFILYNSLKIHAQIFRDFADPAETAKCSIDVDDPYTPLILRKDGKAKIYYPKVGSHMCHIGVNDTVRLSCPGASIILRNKDTRLRRVDATCSYDSDAKNAFKISEIRCSSQIYARLTNTNSVCGKFSNGKFYIVMFYHGYGITTRIYSVCYDTFLFLPLFAFFSTPMTLRDEDKNFDDSDRRVFLDNDPNIYNDVKWVLRIENQRQIINQLLSLDPQSTKYVSDDNHLVPSFLISAQNLFYKAQQNATYRYVNAAPQWKSIKNGNWVKIGREIRAYVRMYRRSVMIWTGVHGHCALYGASPQGDERIYISVLMYKRAERMPVPSHFWTVVFDYRKQAGIALITVNNPYEKLIRKEIICPDISNQTGWLEFNSKHDIEQGYSFACDVRDFQNVVHNSPDIRFHQVLTF